MNQHRTKAKSQQNKDRESSAGQANTRYTAGRPEEQRRWLDLNAKCSSKQKVQCRCTERQVSGGEFPSIVPFKQQSNNQFQDRTKCDDASSKHSAIKRRQTHSKTNLHPTCRINSTENQDQSRLQVRPHKCCTESSSSTVRITPDATRRSAAAIATTLPMREAESKLSRNTSHHTAFQRLYQCAMQKLREVACNSNNWNAAETKDEIN